MRVRKQCLLLLGTSALLLLKRERKKRDVGINKVFRESRFLPKPVGSRSEKRNDAKKENMSPKPDPEKREALNECPRTLDSNSEI
jgi:hypothetical protein